MSLETLLTPESLSREQKKALAQKRISLFVPHRHTTVPIITGLDGRRLVAPFTANTEISQRDVTAKLFFELRKHYLEQNDRLFEHKTVGVVIPDLKSGRAYTKRLLQQLKLKGKNDIQVEGIPMVIPHRVDYDSEGKSIANTRRDKIDSSVNEVSGAMGRQLLARFLVYDNDLFVLACVTAGLSVYLEDAKKYLAVFSDNLRAAAHVSVLPQSISILDEKFLSLESSAQQKKAVEQAFTPKLTQRQKIIGLLKGEVTLQGQPSKKTLYDSFLYFFDQLPQITEQARSSSESEVQAIAKLFDKVPYGAWLRALLLTKVALGGVSHGMSMTQRMQEPQQGIHYQVLDNLVCATKDLSVGNKETSGKKNFEEIRSYYNMHGKLPPLVLATTLTSENSVTYGHFSPQMKLEIPLDILIDVNHPLHKLQLLPKLQKISQKMIWLNKIYNKQAVPFDMLIKHAVVLSPNEVPRLNLRERKMRTIKRQYWETAAIFFTLLHEIGVSSVKLYCTEMPLIWDDFQNNRAFLSRYGIDFSFPDTLNPADEVIDEVLELFSIATQPAPTE